MKSKLLILLLLLVSSLGFTQNAHFWDGIEAFDGPTDDNPVLAAQLDFYFDKLIAPLPDSITMEIDRLIGRTNYNTNLRDFILWHLLEKYRHPEYMSQDQVFVYLYDQYYSQLEIKDLNEINLALIREKAERLRRLALFNTAPKIQLNDSVDLQSIASKFTVLFFYDHDCDVCQQERQDLDSVCTIHPEIMLLAIDMNTNDIGVDELYDLYDIETTPLIYVLDSDKRIIAKKIRAKQIPLVL
ncbi:MAG: conjugal transfer protein TraF [Bacteroidales bacterium]|nr:conjugal transfer protein TraF [Bacteroidales bacterium]